MSFDDITGRTQQQADSMLGSRYDIRFRGIDNDNTAFSRPFHLNIINTVAGAANHL